MRDREGEGNLPFVVAIVVAAAKHTSAVVVVFVAVEFAVVS